MADECLRRSPSFPREVPRGWRPAVCLCGKEVAPTTGVHHLQGFIAMQPTALRASDGLVGTWKKLFPFLARAHLETARGTDAQNKEYCSKTGDVFLELGTPKLTISLKDFAGLTWKDQMDADPEMAIKSRFQLDSILKRQRAEELQLMIQEQKRKKFSQPLRPWQQTLVDRLLTQPDRHVFSSSTRPATLASPIWLCGFRRHTMRSYVGVERMPTLPSRSRATIH